jgi:hypothetical protein
MLINSEDLAKIQYHGEAGMTRSCLNAIIRLIQFGDQIEEVKLLTFETRHCFLLSFAYQSNYIAIKSGFSSGYSGTGPLGLATAIQLLQPYFPWIEEYNISSSIFHRIDDSCLLTSDIDEINSLKPVLPYRVHKYTYAFGFKDSDSPEQYQRLQQEFPRIVPLRFVDFRIADLALKIKDEPDSTLMSAYRRLEGIIRKRTGLESDVIGAKLFTKAFRGENAPLYWENIESAEREGRAAMFEGIYMAFRNRRAHRELKLNLDEEIREFLLVNELFLLESQAIDRTQKKEET